MCLSYSFDQRFVPANTPAYRCARLKDHHHIPVTLALISARSKHTHTSFYRCKRVLSTFLQNITSQLLHNKKSRMNSTEGENENQNPSMKRKPAENHVVGIYYCTAEGVTTKSETPDRWRIRLSHEIFPLGNTFGDVMYCNFTSKSPGGPFRELMYRRIINMYTYISRLAHENWRKGKYFSKNKTSFLERSERAVGKKKQETKMQPDEKTQLLYQIRFSVDHPPKGRHTGCHGAS